MNLEVLLNLSTGINVEGASLGWGGWGGWWDLNKDSNYPDFHKVCTYL